MNKNIPEINIELETIPIVAKTYKLKTIYKYYLDANGSQLWTNNIFIYYWYKILWKIKPPEFKSYFHPDVEKELIEMIERDIKEYQRKIENGKK